MLPRSPGGGTPGGWLPSNQCRKPVSAGTPQRYFRKHAGQSGFRIDVNSFLPHWWQ